MYNTEIKQNYIEFKVKQSIINKDILVSRFEQCSMFENSYGKDVSEFSMQEAVDMYRTLNYASISVLNIFNSDMAQYTQYCLDRGLINTNQNVYRNITTDILVKCLNKAMMNIQIISRDKLLEYISELPNPRDQFIVLATFEFGVGRDYEDIVGLKIEDINEQNNTVKLPSGRVVNISDKLINIAKDCRETEVYYSKREVKMYDDGTIIKRIRKRTLDNTDNFRAGRRLYRALARSLKYLGLSKYLTAATIESSGKVHMVRTEAIKYGLSPAEYIKDKTHRAEFVNQYDIKNFVMKTFLLTYSDYL